MNWFEWLIVISFFSYCGFVYYVARKNRRTGRN